MSYAVVHMQKFGRGDLGGISSHNQRLKESRTNPDIDPTRVGLNYDLVNTDKPVVYSQLVAERIKEGYKGSKAIRKDAVVMCGIMVTSDKAFFESLSPEDTRRYFDDALTWFKQRYGVSNLVYATVHMDETTPHMHLGIVPLTADGRLSAKSIFDRKELTALQTDFAYDVGTKYGLERGVEGSDRTHLPEVRYKLAKAEEKLAATQEDIVDAQQRLEIEREANNKITEKRKAIERELEKLTQDIKDTQIIVGKLNTEEGSILARIKVIEESGKILAVEQLDKIQTGIHAPIFGKTSLTISDEDYKNLRATAMVGATAKALKEKTEKGKKAPVSRIYKKIIKERKIEPEIEKKSFQSRLVAAKEQANEHNASGVTAKKKQKRQHDER